MKERQLLKMYRIVNGIMLTVAAVCMAQAQSREFESHTFDNGAGFSLPYRFYLPEMRGADNKYPLVIALHGAGEWGSDNQRQLNNFPYHFIDSANSAKYPAYYLAPQCTEDAPWSSFPHYPEVATEATPTKSTQQVLSLIDSLLHCDSIKIDRDRIYITGLSLGGEGVFDIITRAPDLFAAAIPVCGIADTSKAYLMTKTPLWIFHGSADEINSVTYSRIIVDALEKAGYPPKYTEYEGKKHSIWTTAYNEPDLLPWLFAQNKSQVVHNVKIHSMQSSHDSQVSLKKCRNVLSIIWKPSVQPEVIELFTLNGRCAVSREITRSNRHVYTLALKRGRESIGERYIVRVSCRKKVLLQMLI